MDLSKFVDTFANHQTFIKLLKMSKSLLTFLLICFAVLSGTAQNDNTNKADPQRNADAQSTITKEKATTVRADQTSPQAENINAPVIEFDKMVHDYGTLTQQSDGKSTFKFVNTGREPLILSNVRSS